MGELEARAGVQWSGYRGEIRGWSGALAAPTSTQAELGGPGDGTNPEELFAAAHANCFTSTLTSLARARNIPLDRVETTATVRLGWSDGHGDHRLASSALEIRIASAAPWPEVEELVGEAERECPVCRAIAGNVAMTVSLAPLA
ncbi:MAG TPA: OsmC family protein [Gaiellaceae bacterium]|nr:OsmC family protein [Gaiellaceae bacterium]